MNKGGRCAPKVTLENPHNTALLERYPKLGSLAYLLAKTTPRLFCGAFCCAMVLSEKDLKKVEAENPSRSMGTSWDGGSQWCNRLLGAHQGR